LWADGRRYEGYWYQGKQHGLGIYYTNTGLIIKKISNLDYGNKGKELYGFQNKKSKI